MTLALTSTCVGGAARYSVGAAGDEPFDQAAGVHPCRGWPAVGARRFTPDEQLKRAARVRCSVEELIACKPSREAWADVADTLNLIEALAYVGLVRHARDFIGQQQDHIITAMDRQKSTGSNVLLPVECTLLRDLAATWAEVLAEVTYRQFFEAEERVIRKVQAALRRGSHDGLRVLEVA